MNKSRKEFRGNHWRNSDKNSMKTTLRESSKKSREVSLKGFLTATLEIIQQESYWCNLENNSLKNARRNLLRALERNKWRDLRKDPGEIPNWIAEETPKGNPDQCKDPEKSLKRWYKYLKNPGRNVKRNPRRNVWYNPTKNSWWKHWIICRKIPEGIPWDSG